MQKGMLVEDEILLDPTRTKEKEGERMTDG